MLTDNGAIFTAESRNGACAMELELLALGVDYKHSRPYHPQTCGKVERFHQTLKKWLAKQAPSAPSHPAPGPLDSFRRLLQPHPTPPGPRPAHPRPGLRRPHQSQTRRAPNVKPDYRVRHDKVSKAGN